MSGQVLYIVQYITVWSSVKQSSDHKGSQARVVNDSSKERQLSPGVEYVGRHVVMTLRHFGAIYGTL